MSQYTKDQEVEFVGLLTEHQTLIRAYVISLLPGLSETDDVIQETNQVLWMKRETFELGTNFKAWALATARFQVMAFQQKLKREMRAPLDEDVLMMVADEAQGRDVATLNQRINDLNDCIGRLQVKDQELVLHRYWKKSKLEEYAKASGRSVGSLKVALHRVRASLRDCIERKSKAREELA
ncbi:MAG: sigma-70 family RNA polymerase sigma factor [Verrucomicrobiae bacterium]|nr:sigma-70 family RNA polymerase sigma factor [Verrucomicrobiae bacterium]NNJ85919.1 sigma-70 family RNA polymerase sigma factor [Akkermansiaceae bacterium]